MAYRRPRSQPRLGSRRIPAYTGLIEDLETAIKYEMRRYNVSRSFVIATAVAFALSVQEQPDYRKPTAKKTKPSDFRPNKALKLVERPSQRKTG